MKVFQTLQRQFLAHLRNPALHALPAGFPEQGAAIYKELLFNKFNDSLALCFPVTRDILGESAWQQLLQAFIAEHRCHSPYYRQIPDEFIHYLQTERVSETDPPFLLELAHFEWVELILAITDTAEVEDNPLSNSNTINDWLACLPLFVPLFEVLHYSFPVHRINVDYQPEAPPEQPTHILGFRDVRNTVQFIELQPATVRLLEILQATEVTVHEAITAIAAELAHLDPEALFRFGVEFMTQLYEQGAIRGVLHD